VSIGPRVLGPAPARNLAVQAMPPGRQRALGELRESEALLDRLIAATVERGSRRSAYRQRDRLRRVGIEADYIA
jgi:hypothetical protein